MNKKLLLLISQLSEYFESLGFSLRKDKSDNSIVLKAVQNNLTFKLELEQTGKTHSYSLYDCSLKVFMGDSVYLLLLSERTQDCINEDNLDIKRVVKAISKNEYHLEKVKMLLLFKRTYLTIDDGENNQISLLKVK